MNFSDNIITPQDSELGKKTTYDTVYNPDKLFPILRANKRAEININPDTLPFYGFDDWNHFEVSWLNEKGKPIVAVAEIRFDANSPYLIESKSMKLYFNSFNSTKFVDSAHLAKVIKQDLESRVSSTVQVKVTPLNDVTQDDRKVFFDGNSIDDLDIECSIFTVSPNLLQIEENEVEEILYSDLLRSNCLVTGQPDWGSIQIAYQGRKMNHEALLRYIVSFRDHTEFGEHCAERIFMDLMQHCKPKRLSIHARYTRRGGIDINCYRSTHAISEIIANQRLYRQ